MIDWQPIETAPKGEVLLYYPEVWQERHGHLRKIHTPMYRVEHAPGGAFRKATHWAKLDAPSS